MHEGLAAGIGSVPGRLAVTPGSGVAISEYEIDDTPLWSFLSPDGHAYCDRFDLSGLPGVADTRDDMVACMETYAANAMTVTLFEDDIASASRFVWLPQFWAHELYLGTSRPLNVREFHSVYLQTTMWGCDAVECAVSHDPGEPVADVVLRRAQIDLVTAIQIPVQALPESVRLEH